MRILNLGCGTKVSASPDVVNIDWSVYLRIKSSPLLRPLARLVATGERRARFDALPDNILVANLARGIPFADASVDAVYHSHLLEHLDREPAEGFLREIHRVLKPDGVVRIAVPDLEKACRAYLAHLEACARGEADPATHDDAIAPILEQCVRREGYGTRHQKPLRRWLENRILGDARKRGETHQWMYDRVNLAALLIRTGFRDPVVQTHTRSLIPDWDAYGLERNRQGGEYKPDSLYMEARKIG
jgi:SAM-dependent methyltransferase